MGLQPKTGQVMLSTRVPATLQARLKEYSARSRIPVRELIETWMTERLDEVDPAGKLRHAPVPAPGGEEDRMGKIEDRLGQLAGAIETLVRSQTHEAKKRGRG